jgi:hypothetical protein
MSDCCRKNTTSRPNDGGENRHHRVVDPDIDAAAFGGDRVGCREHGIGVGDVERHDHGATAKPLDLATNGVQRLTVARHQCKMGAGPGKPQGRGAADAGGCAGDDDRGLR